MATTSASSSASSCSSDGKALYQWSNPAKAKRTVIVRRRSQEVLRYLAHGRDNVIRVGLGHPRADANAERTAQQVFAARAHAQVVGARGRVFRTIERTALGPRGPAVEQRGVGVDRAAAIDT